MQIVKDNIKLEELEKISQKMFDNLVKTVVDIDKCIMAIDGEMHVDLEELMLENNCIQKDLWRINLYPRI